MRQVRSVASVQSESDVLVRYRGSDGQFVDTGLDRLPTEDVLSGLNAATLATANRQISRPRNPAPLTPFDDIPVDRLRNTRPLLTVLRDPLDHPGEFYGLEVLHRTNISEAVLYPILHRLLRAGWLTSRPEDEHSWLAGAPPGRGPGRCRTYYNLTTNGRRAAFHEVNYHKPRNASRRPTESRRHRDRQQH